MEKNREIQVPAFVAKPVEKREISKPRCGESKTYKPAKQKMLNKIKKLMAITIASASLGATLLTGISVYNNQQTTRQANSYEAQITDYNHELYNKIQDLKEDGLRDLSNDELRMLIQEVNENNYNAVKDKIAGIIPDYSGNLTMMRTDDSKGTVKFTASYGDKFFTINDSRIEGAVERYIEVKELVESTENGDIDRSLLEKNLMQLADEMKENADLGVYFNTPNGLAKSGTLKSYSIEKNKKKIEEKLEEINEEKVNEDDERGE